MVSKLLSRLVRWGVYVLVFLVIILILAYGAGQFYKPRILARINELLKESVNGEVEVGGLDFTIFDQFPNLSISLKDVYLRGPEYQQYHREFLRAEKISVRIRGLHLLAREIDLRAITLKNASIQIFKTKDGYSNLDVFKKKEKAPVTATTPGASPMSLVIARISLQNTKVIFSDSVKGKAYGATFTNSRVEIEPTDSSQLISLRGDMTFNGMMLNAAKGSYLLDKRVFSDLHLEVIPAAKRMDVHASSLQFDKSKIDLTGRFEFSEASGFRLRARSENLDYGEGMTIITQALRDKLGKFNFSKPFHIDLLLDGSLKGGEPKIDLGFSMKETSARLGSVQLDSLTLSGIFQNHVDSLQPFGDSNSRVAVDQLSGKANGMPVAGKVEIINFKDPRALVHTRTAFNLARLNHHTDSAKMIFHKGSVLVEVDFDGRLTEYLHDTTTHFTSKLNGNFQLKDASWSMPKVNKEFKDVEVDISFTEEEMMLNKVHSRVNGNETELNGKVTGFVPFFFQPAEKGKVQLSIRSPKMDLRSLLKKQQKQAKRAGKTKGGSRVSDMLDLLYHKVEFDLDVEVGELRSGPFHANEVKGRFILEQDRFTMKPAGMRFAGGTTQLALTMKGLNQDSSDLAFEAHIKNADIKRVFECFGNFSQKAIRADNISGKASVDISLTARLDNDFKLRLPSVQGAVRLRVQNGELSNCEPLMKMSNFLFKNRDFEKVEFAEINSQFKVHGSSLDIARMEVQSSVLTLFVEGQYSLAKETDLSIQIPLSNLKKRDKTYKPENVGTDAKVGASVFLRARPDKEGKISIAYDPLKKFRGSKKKS